METKNTVTNETNEISADALANDAIEGYNAEESSYAATSEGFEPLPSGKALSLSEVYCVKAKEKTTVIVLVGPSSSGKTTIETALYQLFLAGKDSEFSFAGSQTIQGYQERVHYSTIHSREAVSTTPRTVRASEELFLHLRLLEHKSKCIANYLFADISGEEFQFSIADVSSLKNAVPYIQQANHLVFVLDGDLLTKNKTRNGVIDEMNSMIRTVLDAELYSDITEFQILVSKYDIVKANSNKAAEEYIHKRVDELCNLIKGKIGRDTSVHCVAAMPHEDSLPTGYGLNELLSSWHYVPRKLPSPNTYQIDNDMTSEFNKLSYKLAGDLHE